MERIDTHHHFWFYDPKEYPWITEEMAVLRRNFVPEDFESDLRKLGITGIIPVQAHESWRETWQLLQFANEFSLIQGVVGWLPLLDSDLDRKLPVLAEHPKLRGVRYILQDQSDATLIESHEFNAGLSRIKPYHLAYDILIYEHQLPEAIDLIDRHAGQVFVLDHVAKPRIAAGEMEPWRTNLQALAERPLTYCKLSGLLTEADWKNWTRDQIRPYLDVALKAFGPDRLMFGSDWPVCLLAGKYADWFALIGDYIATLTVDEQARIWAGTAREAYRLQPQT